MGKHRQARLDGIAERAVQLFKEGESYGKIATALSITKAEAKSKVRAGLSVAPQLARQLHKVKS